MATVTFGNSLASTSNGASYNLTAFTPAAGDLIVVFTMHTGTSTVTAGGSLSDTQGLSYELLGSQLFNTSQYCLQLWVAKSTAANSSNTIAVTTPGTVQGCAGAAYRVAGAEGVYVRQFAFATGAAASTPTVVLGAAALTGNSLMGAVGNTSNPATLTPRSSPVWTESLDTGYNSPTTGFECAFVNSGDTASSIAWGGTSATAWCACVVELYTAGTCAAPVYGGSGYYGGVGAI